MGNHPKEIRAELILTHEKDYTTTLRPRAEAEWDIDNPLPGWRYIYYLDVVGLGQALTAGEAECRLRGIGEMVRWAAEGRGGRAYRWGGDEFLAITTIEWQVMGRVDMGPFGSLRAWDRDRSLDAHLPLRSLVKSITEQAWTEARARKGRRA